MMPRIAVTAVFLGAGLGLPVSADAQFCTPNGSTDIDAVSGPLVAGGQFIELAQFAQDFRPGDCAVVEQTPPDFRWPAVGQSAGDALILTYPDGHSRMSVATQNWLNWDEILPAGTYSWTVIHAGGGTSGTRRFKVGEQATPFLAPGRSAVFDNISTKAHPRSLPDAATLASMQSQRQDALAALQADVDGRLDQPLPDAGNSADDAYTYSKLALASLQACVFGNRDSHCNDAVRRVTNLAAWDPRGVTSYLTPGADMAARYLAWTVATGYDWLHPRFDYGQRARILEMLRVRTGDMYDRIVAARVNIAQYPRDSHGNQTLTVVALIAGLLAGDLPEAAEWLPNVLPLALNAINPWGGEESGFANATAQGLWDVGEMLPLWYQLRVAGIDVAQKPWVRNWGRYFAYFTPPGMAEGSTVFGDGFELNETEHQARFGKGYTYFNPTPLGRWHASLLGGEDPTRIEYLMAPPADFSGAQAYPAGTPNALYLPSIGQVALHSDLSNLARTSVYFKSSPPPYGAFNHSHADQNSFVVNAGGQRLAIESGYYDGYMTAHGVSWYHTTQAKNAITYDDGQGQSFFEKNGELGHGRITAFSSSATHDIVSGDATPAYGGALSKAQRSLVYLRPNLILVYDNLASASSRQWEWNIHAANPMTVFSDTRISIRNGGQQLCVTVLAGPKVRFAQTDRFAADPKGIWAPQWHGKFYSSFRTPQAEFIVLLDVGCAGAEVRVGKMNDVWTVTLGESVVTLGGAISVERLP